MCCVEKVDVRSVVPNAPQTERACRSTLEVDDDGGVAAAAAEASRIISSVSATTTVVFAFG